MDAPTKGWRLALRAALPALAVAVAILGAFAGKPFTIDDTLFLSQARHALVDPLHPAAFAIVWADHVERLSTIMPSGPVEPWLLAPVVAHGAHEWAAHLVGIAMLALGLVGTAALALRLGLDRRQASWASLLVATAPVVLGMAGTSMPDVPAMSLGVVGMERALAWRDGRRPHQGLAAALFLGLATLTRSHLVMLIPVAAIGMIDRDVLFAPRRWPSARTLAALARIAAPLVGAGVVVLAVVRLTRDPLAGAGVAAATGHFLTWRILDRHSLAFAMHWCFALPFTLPWLLLRGRRLWWSTLWQTIPVAIIVMYQSPDAPWLYWAPLAAVSVTALLDAVADAWRRRDAVDLLCAGWLFVAVPVMFYVQLPPKYLVASAPGLAVLLVRQAARTSGFKVLAGTAVFGALLGIAILRADENFARFERRAVDELIAPAVARGERVWFAGHWGFHWYAAQAGARPLAADGEQPRDGDLVVSDEMACSNDQLAHFPHRRLVSTLTDATPGGRIHSREDFVGFYTDITGYLPWGWSRRDLDRFDVWRIDASATVKDVDRAR